MKIAVVFYSYSGNTKKVAGILNDELSKNNQVDLLEIKALDESRNFFMQCWRARRKKRSKIEDMKFDLSSYDLVMFGTPVWAFEPAPALWTYFDKCSGLKDKKATLFITYGSGSGKGHCLDHMEKALKEKGAKEIKRIQIQQFKVKDAAYVSDTLKNNL